MDFAWFCLFYPHKFYWFIAVVYVFSSNSIVLKTMSYKVIDILMTA